MSSAEKGITSREGKGRFIKSTARGMGAWVPWDVAMDLCRLDLKPASSSKVFLAVAFTSLRYGGSPARLGVDDLAAMTDLSSRTVKKAMTVLITGGLLSRTARYKSIRVNFAALISPKSGQVQVLPPQAGRDSGGDDKLAPPPPIPPIDRGAYKPAPPRGKLAGPSPTTLHVSLDKRENSEANRPTFTPKQLTLMKDLFGEASQLLGSDARDLELPPVDVQKLGLETRSDLPHGLGMDRQGGRSGCRAFLRGHGPGAPPRRSRPGSRPHPDRRAGGVTAWNEPHVAASAARCIGRPVRNRGPFSPRPSEPLGWLPRQLRAGG